MFHGGCNITMMGCDKFFNGRPRRSLYAASAATQSSWVRLAGASANRVRKVRVVTPRRRATRVWASISDGAGVAVSSSLTIRRAVSASCRQVHSPIVLVWPSEGPLHQEGADRRRPDAHIWPSSQGRCGRARGQFAAVMHRHGRAHFSARLCRRSWIRTSGRLMIALVRSQGTAAGVVIGQPDA